MRYFFALLYKKIFTKNNFYLLRCITKIKKQLAAAYKKNNYHIFKSGTEGKKNKNQFPYFPRVKTQGN